MIQQQILQRNWARRSLGMMPPTRRRERMHTSINRAGLDSTRRWVTGRPATWARRTTNTFNPLVATRRAFLVGPANRPAFPAPGHKGKPAASRLPVPRHRRLARSCEAGGLATLPRRGPHPPDRGLPRRLPRPEIPHHLDSHSNLSNHLEHPIKFLNNTHLVSPSPRQIHRGR